MSNIAGSVLSMTGYAVVEKTFGKKTFRLHLKAVNNRFTEIRVRLPRAYNALETEVRTLVPKRAQRGSCDFWMEECFPQGKTAQGAMAVKNFFEQLAIALQESKKVAGLHTPAALRAMILARYPQVWLNEATEEELSLPKEDFIAALEALCKQLEDNRRVEGKTISTALSQQIDDIEMFRNEIAAQLPSIRAEWEKNLKERVQKLCSDAGVPAPSEERVLQELLFLGEKRDIAEEVQRIGAHVVAVRESLKTPPNNFGKRLEFLLQELHREWTTLGNKIQSVDCSRKVVDAKLAIEKMREQSLNVV